MSTNQLVSSLVSEERSALHITDLRPMGPHISTYSSTFELPQTIDELSAQISRTYDLSIATAGELRIPAVGNVSGGSNRRVVVLERAAYKEIKQDTTKYQWGYAIRLSITVSKLTTDTKLTLPFLAAAAEVGQIEARWSVQVLGLAGTKIDSVIIPPTELNVETFVLAKQSLISLVDAVRDPSTRFSPQLVAIQDEANEIDNAYLMAVWKAYGLRAIEKGRCLLEARKELDSGRDQMREAIVCVYHEFAEITSETEAPSLQVRRRAANLLNGLLIEPKLRELVSSLFKRWWSR